MKSEEPIKNYKLEAGDPKRNIPPLYVQEYVNQSVIELFAPPTSDAHLKVQVNQQKDIIVDDDEFYIAVTQQQLEMTGIQLPIVVAKVTKDNWKITNWQIIIDQYK